MGIFSRFERGMEDGLEGAASKMFDTPISPVQISKKAERAMKREKMVGAGRQYAPTLYTVLVNADDDQRLFGYYPTLAGETETYLRAKAHEEGLSMDGQPLVRFIVDEDLKHGKFDIIAEMVSAPIIAQLRSEEMARYGLAPQPRGAAVPNQQQTYRQQQPTFNPLDRLESNAPAPAVAAASTPVASPRSPLPYVPESEIDRSIDYGEYTFNSQDFENHENEGARPGAQENDGYQARGNYTQPETGAPSAQPDTALFTDGAKAAHIARNAQARLVNTATGRAYTLDSARMVIGRSSASNLIIDDVNASRSHAELRFEPNGAWVITDLRSTNGTYVNGQRITTHQLVPGDRVSIGMTDLEFALSN